MAPLVASFSIKILLLQIVGLLPIARMILNITGGFKIVSAWVQSYATLHGLLTIYKYESGDTLIVTTTNAPATLPSISFYV